MFCKVCSINCSVKCIVKCSVKCSLKGKVKFCVTQSGKNDIEFSVMWSVKCIKRVVPSLVQSLV